MSGLTIFCLCMAIVLCIVLISVIFGLQRRERKLLAHLKSMLNNAIAGTFTEGPLQDNRISEIESDMWRFLKGSQASSQKLQEQKQKLQSLISDTSHQAAAPLSNIKIYAEMLKERQEACKQQYGIRETDMAEELRVIQAQAEKLEFLLDSLAKLSCLETGAISLVPESICVSELLLNIKRQFRKKAEQKGIAFQMQDSKELVQADLRWAEEAVANIVDNAIKYTPAGGCVSIRTISYPMFLCIQVSDTGIGIKEGELPKIFARFYRSPAVKREPGIGVGLALAREIMEKQKGYIKVSSEPGKGSRFSLYFTHGQKTKQES